MKKVILTLFLLFFSVIIFAQNKKEYKNYKIQYKLYYVIDTLNPNLTKTELFTLYISQGISKFVSNRKLYLDSILKRAKSDRLYALSLMSNLGRIPKANFSFEIYKTDADKKITIIDNVINDKYIYTENQDNNWNIKTDTLTIKGFKCQKALKKFKGRNYIAWFTTEIPLSNGPYKFQGLPGLIIKIYDTKRDYDFILDGLLEDNKTIISSPDFNNRKFIKTTSKEFNSIRKNASKNYFQRLEQMGIHLKEYGKKFFGNKLKLKLQNPIELNNN